MQCEEKSQQLTALKKNQNSTYKRPVLTHAGKYILKLILYISAIKAIN